MDRKQLSNEDENGKEGEHVYVKGHSEYGSMFWEYESDDVVILNFSMFLSVCWGEKHRHCYYSFGEHTAVLSVQ